MLTDELNTIIIEQKAISSIHLNRYVIVDFYLPKNIVDPSGMSLLLINDGQDLDDMPFAKIYDELLYAKSMQPLVCVGIHANKNRRNEYGVASTADYAGRGAKAINFKKFILEELLLFIHNEYAIENFATVGYAGFSLGGLTALDIVWDQPDIFSVAGVFSGSLWWRSKDLGVDYDDDKHRIMHQIIKKNNYQKGLKFYFTTGSQDEIADRNNNGIIDSIDDTLDLIKELKELGYEGEEDIKYINYEDGKHDVATWGRAIPDFLKWGWGK